MKLVANFSISKLQMYRTFRREKCLYLLPLFFFCLIFACICSFVPYVVKEKQNVINILLHYVMGDFQIYMHKILIYGFTRQQPYLKMVYIKRKFVLPKIGLF